MIHLYETNKGNRGTKTLFFSFLSFQKRFLKSLIIILLLINLSGCGLIGLLLQLAPLATIFVYYSAPTEIEEGKILCFKTVRTYEKKADENNISYAQNTNNEYYLCLIEYEKGKITELAQILDDKFYELDEGVIYYKEDKDKIIFALNNPRETWQLDIDGSNIEKISDEGISYVGVTSSKNLYAYLPSPVIEEISSY